MKFKIGDKVVKKRDYVWNESHISFGIIDRLDSKNWAILNVFSKSGQFLHSNYDVWIPSIMIFENENKKNHPLTKIFK